MQSIIDLLSPRWKAVAGFLVSYAAILWAYYQANPHLGLKAFVLGFIGSLATGGAVHQVSNVGE